MPMILELSVHKQNISLHMICVPDSKPPKHFKASELVSLLAECYVCTNLKVMLVSGLTSGWVSKESLKTARYLGGV